MRLSFGIFLGYILVALLAAYFVLNVFVDEIKPSARGAMEESLLDAANLLAEVAAEDLRAGTLTSGIFARQVAAYQARPLDASIWGFSRKGAGFRIYVTDDQGIVRYDSTGRDLGRDFSRWNDVYLTLQGRYGVRSSPDIDAPESSSMYVAAPVKNQDRIIGVLTVAKSNRAVEPFIERTRNKIINASYWLLAASLLVGALMSYWLSTSIRRLASYAEAVSRGERAILPALSLTEIKRLGLALELMRERLEGRKYVEDYIVTLTHEMKSPLTAIRASTELLEEEMPEAQRRKFLASIAEQSDRLHVLMGRMLEQAKLENRQALEERTDVDLRALVQKVLANLNARLEKKQLALQLEAPDALIVSGDAFLLEQALQNICDNAIAFSPDRSTLALRLENRDGEFQLILRDQGPGIPEYALPRIFERYYSLPRPDGGAKSSGLGLAFVQQVMALHQGQVELKNHPEGGVEARLIFPKMT